MGNLRNEIERSMPVHAERVRRENRERIAMVCAVYAAAAVFGGLLLRGACHGF